MKMNELDIKSGTVSKAQHITKITSLVCFLRSSNGNCHALDPLRSLSTVYKLLIRCRSFVKS